MYLTGSARRRIWGNEGCLLPSRSLRSVLEKGLETYSFGTPFGHNLLSVDSVEKGLDLILKEWNDY